MRALCWHGIEDVRVETVPDPELLNPHDAILEITRTAICGSDLHLYDGTIPTMRAGDVLGHEFMGTVVETGPEVIGLQVGERVVVAFPIACGRCAHCEREEHSLCDNTNPNAWMAEAAWGASPAGIYGYSHLLGGYAGGQAEYVRVPFADVGCLRVPDELSDEQVLFLSDIYPTGWQAAEQCGIESGDTVAVWGCGPVGQFAIRSALLLGAERVLAIDRVPDRLELAGSVDGVEVLDYESADLLAEIKERTGGRGPDACIDAVGLEAHGTGILARIDRAKLTLRLATDRPTALRQAIQACRKGGTVSIPGVYGGVVDKLPMGAAFNKGLTFRMGQTHVQPIMPRLLETIVEGRIDPTFLITHRVPLDEAPRAYADFREKRDGCIKVVMEP